MAYKDPLAEDTGPETNAQEQSDEGGDVKTPDDKYFWIPGDKLGGNCKKGDTYTIEATGDPDEDGDVPVKLVSSNDSKSESDDSGMREAFASKPSMES